MLKCIIAIDEMWIRSFEPELKCQNSLWHLPSFQWPVKSPQSSNNLKQPNEHVLKWSHKILVDIVNNAIFRCFFLQIIHEYTGYDHTKAPDDLQFSGCAQRIFALKFHPEYDDVFITGGWDRQLKVHLILITWFWLFGHI